MIYLRVLKLIVIIKGINAIIRARYQAHLCFKQRSHAGNPIISIICTDIKTISETIIIILFTIIKSL